MSQKQIGRYVVIRGLVDLRRRCSKVPELELGSVIRLEKQRADPPSVRLQVSERGGLTSVTANCYTGFKGKDSGPHRFPGKVRFSGAGKPGGGGQRCPWAKLPGTVIRVSLILGLEGGQI